LKITYTIKKFVQSESDPSSIKRNAAMAVQKLSGANRPFVRLRRNILEYLYGLFKRYPYSSIELGEIAEFCQTSPEELNWNIVYLEKHGWVELAKSIPCPPYVACSAGLTASGIDLIENAKEFNLRLPESG